MRLVATILLLAFGASACGGYTGTGDDPGGSGEEGPGSPVGAWELSSAEPPIEVPDGARVTLTIEERDGQLQAGGTAACNQYGGTLQVDGDAWAIDQLSWTEMGCEPALMEAESAYLDALMAIETWSRDGGTLELRGGEVTLTFALLPEVEPASFTGTTWEVDGFIQGAGDDGAVSSGVAGVEPATLRLDDDGTLTLFTGCRDFTGEWATSGDEIVLPSWGQAPDSRGVDADGELTCGEQAEAQELQVLAVVESGFTAEVDGQRLTLLRGDLGLTARPAD